MRPSRLSLGWIAALLIGCAQGPPPPAPLDTRNDSCRHCRMLVSQPRFAAQLVGPGEEPLLFDDIGCLRDYLAGAAELRAGSIAYVADHRTAEWVAASRALYARAPELDTPMGSHLIAHADRASRAADPSADDAEELSATEVFGPGGPPDGT